MLSLFTHHFRLLKRKAIPIFHCCRTNFLRQLDTCLCVPSGCHNFRCLKSADPPLRPTQCTAPLISQHNPVWFLTAPGSAALQPVMSQVCETPALVPHWFSSPFYRCLYMPHISRQPRCPSYFLPNTSDWLPSSCLIFTFHICLPKKTTKLLCLECYQENSWEWNWSFSRHCTKMKVLKTNGMHTWCIAYKGVLIYHCTDQICKTSSFLPDSWVHFLNTLPFSTAIASKRWKEYQGQMTVSCGSVRVLNSNG